MLLLYLHQILAKVILPKQGSTVEDLDEGRGFWLGLGQEPVVQCNTENDPTAECQGLKWTDDEVKLQTKRVLPIVNTQQRADRSANSTGGMVC